MNVERALVEMEKLDGQLELQRWRREQLRTAIFQAKRQNTEFAELESERCITYSYSYFSLPVFVRHCLRHSLCDETMCTVLHCTCTVLLQVSAQRQRQRL